MAFRKKESNLLEWTASFQPNRPSIRNRTEQSAPPVSRNPNCGLIATTGMGQPALSLGRLGLLRQPGWYGIWRKLSAAELHARRYLLCSTGPKRVLKFCSTRDASASS